MKFKRIHVYLIVAMALVIANLYYALMDDGLAAVMHSEDDFKKRAESDSIRRMRYFDAAGIEKNELRDIFEFDKAPDEAPDLAALPKAPVASEDNTREGDPQSSLAEVENPIKVLGIARHGSVTSALIEYNSTKMVVYRGSTIGAKYMVIDIDKDKLKLKSIR